MALDFSGLMGELPTPPSGVATDLAKTMSPHEPEAPLAPRIPNEFGNAPYKMAHQKRMTMKNTIQ